MMDFFELCLLTAIAAAAVSPILFITGIDDGNSSAVIVCCLLVLSVPVVTVFERAYAERKLEKGEVVDWSAESVDNQNMDQEVFCLAEIKDDDPYDDEYYDGDDTYDEGPDEDDARYDDGTYEEEVYGERTYRMSRKSTCYEAIQVILRNALVDVVRSRFSSSFGEGAASELRGCFQTQWDAMLRDAEKLGPLCDDFDALDFKHFLTLFTKNFEILRPSQSIIKKGHLLNKVGEIKRYRDYVAHPRTVDLNDREAVYVLSVVTRVLDVFQLPGPASQVQSMMREALANPSPCEECTVT